jgi:hypothetical protein
MEVWHRVPGHLAAYAVKPKIGHVMLAATIEAAADFNVQILYGFVEMSILFRQPLAQFRRQSPRRGDTQFAGVRARTGDDV